MLGHASNLIAAGLLATMIVACLYCARELWRDGTARAWVVVALMNIAMIALHLPAPAHHHGATSAAAPSPSTLMAVATLLALVEVVAATAALYRAAGAVHQRSLPPAQYSFLARAPAQRYTRPLSFRASASRTAGTRPSRLIAALRIGRAARGSVASRVSRSVIVTTSLAIGRRTAL